MPEHRCEWRAERRGALGLLRTPPANGMHINTTGRQASGPENRVRALASKDRCRATWKSQEKRQSSRRRPYGYRCPLVQYRSTRPDKTPSSAIWSKHPAARQARCGDRQADRLHYYFRPSALAAPFACHQADAHPSARKATMVDVLLMQALRKRSLTRLHI